MSAPARPPQGPQGPQAGGEGAAGNWRRTARIVVSSAVLVALVAFLYAAYCYLIAGSLLYALSSHDANPWAAYVAGAVAVGAAFILLGATMVLAILATRRGS